MYLGALPPDPLVLASLEEDVEKRAAVLDIPNGLHGGLI